LKCFGQHLSAGTGVEIDDDGRASELAEKYCQTVIEGRFSAIGFPENGWKLSLGPILESLD
jgi:hypothetical protein